MTQLIAVQQTHINRDLVQTVNARDLHHFLQVGKDFSNWIKDRIAKYGFVEGDDYVTNGSPVSANQNRRGGDRRSIEYHLSLDMAKELAMVERNEKGKEARLYFIECERKAKAPALDLNNPASLRAALLSYTEKVEVLEATVAEQAPKVEGFDRIADGHGALTIRAAAKAAQTKEMHFKAMLMEIGWTFKQGKKVHAYSDILHKCYLLHKLFEYRPGKHDHQVLVTVKGMALLAKTHIPAYIARSNFDNL